MSHVATVDLQILDLTALARACGQCGLTFIEGQETYKWWGRWVNDYHENDAAYKNGIPVEDYGKCEHVLSQTDNPTGYEVGIVKRRDGKPGWNIIFDFMDQKLMQKIGSPEIDAKTGKPMAGAIKNANRLRQAYAEQVAQALCRSKGFQVLRDTAPDGKVILRAIRPS